MKEILSQAFSVWLNSSTDIDTETKKILARSTGLEYIEDASSLPDTEDISIFLITTKKMISSAIDYIPVHRSSHLVTPLDFDKIRQRFINHGRLSIGGSMGHGKTALAYLLLRSLPRPFWLIKLKGNIILDGDLLERFSLATDTPGVVFADLDTYHTHIGGIRPSPSILTLSLSHREGDITLGKHSRDAARFMAEEILKAPVEKPGGPRSWIEIALYIRNRRRNPEFAKDIWERGLDSAWENLVSSLPKEALFLLSVVAREGSIASPKKLIKLRYPKVKNLDFIEKLISLGILHRREDGHFTLIHPYWKNKMNGIINIG